LLAAIATATGQQTYHYTTLAGARRDTSGALNFPQGLAFDAAGTLFVADGNNCVVRKISAAGAVSTFAGTLGKQEHLDGPAAESVFRAPTALAFDAQGNLFVGDPTDNAVRKITPQGEVSTVAAGVFPSGLVIAPDGTIFIAEGGFGTVRKISPAGVVSDFVGLFWNPGNRDGQGTEARFGWANDIVRAPDGTLFVADANNSSIRQITPDGRVTTLPIRIVDVPGGRITTLDGACGLARDAAGNLYVAAGQIASVWKVNANAEATLVAGSVNLAVETSEASGMKQFVRGLRDGVGRSAQFESPSRITFGPAGYLYVSDIGNGSVREISPEGKVLTLVGPPAGSVDGEGTRARFTGPWGIALDRAGNLYVADADAHTIRRITSAGVVSTVAGAAGEAGFRDGTASTARFSRPSAVALRGDGVLFVADSGNAAIRAITPAGLVSTFAGGFGGSADGVGTRAEFYDPSGLAFDRAGNLYVLDSGNSTVRKISPAGVVTTIAGAPRQTGLVDGLGAAARFYFPRLGIVADAQDNIYVSDSANSAIRKISPDGHVTTLAGGHNGQPEGPEGIAVNVPYGLALDPQGNLLVAADRTILRLTPAGALGKLPGGPVPLDDPSIALAGSAGFLHGLAVDGAGTLYVVDPWNARVMRGEPMLRPRLTNLSVRAAAGVGAEALIAGFVAQGTGRTRLLVRGVGPSLGLLGVADTAADPRLTVYDPLSDVRGTNDDWDSSDALASAFASVGAFALPRGSRDAALQLDLPPGAYTAHTASATPGAALFELYETAAAPDAWLGNLSARQRVGGAAGALTAGFTISAGAPKTVLIRGIGPTLATFLSGAAARPELKVFRAGGALVATNAGWGGAGEIERVTTRVGAFPIGFTSRDAALLLTLAAGSYTVELSTADGASGLALLEIYDADYF
jgi:sugar lactone lactonase YvrE